MSRSTRIAALVIAALVGLPLAGASAFTLDRRWHTGVVEYHINNQGFRGSTLPTSVQSAAIEGGADEWQFEGCSPFQFNRLGATTTRIDNDGRNVVLVPEISSLPANALAQTTQRFRSDDPERLIEFDMEFNQHFVVGVPGNGTVMSGGGIAFGNMTGSGSEVVLSALDNVHPGLDYWRVTFGTSCQNGCSFVTPANIPAGGTHLASSAVALGELDTGAFGQETVLSAIDRFDGGTDYWRVRALRSCGTDPSTCVRSPILQVHPPGVNRMTGGGVAVANVFGNSKPEIFLLGVEEVDGGLDNWILAVLTDCDASLSCAAQNFHTIPTQGTVVTGGGIAVGELDGTPGLEILIAGIDNFDEGHDYWRANVVECTNGAVCTAGTTIIQVGSGGTTLTGGGVAIGNVDGDSDNEVMLGAIDVWEGLDYWRVARLDDDCFDTAPGCSTEITQVPGGGSVMSGGGVMLADLDASGTPELVLSGIDNYEDGLDYWRVAFGRDCDGGVCPIGRAFSTSGAPGTTDIQSVAAHEFGHAAGLNHTAAVPSAVMTCSIGTGMQRRDLTCDDVHGLQQLYSTSSVCPNFGKVQTLSTGLADAEGGHAVAVDLGGSTHGVMTIAVERGVPNPRWAIGVGSGCSTVTGECSWAPAQRIQSEAEALSSPSIAVGRFDGDADDDVIISAISTEADGTQGVRYRIGTECKSTGCEWGDEHFRPLTGASHPLTGGGVAVGRVVDDGSERPQVVIAAIERRPGAPDQWVYEIGIACGADDCVFSGFPQNVSSGVDDLVGGGVDIGSLDTSGTEEVVLAGIRTDPLDSDDWVVAILRDCSTNSCVSPSAPFTVSAAENGPAMMCGASRGQLLSDAAGTMRGGGVYVGDLSGGPEDEILISGIDAGDDHHFYRHVLLSNCDVGVQTCPAPTAARVTSSGAAGLSGGGITARRVDGDLDYDAVLVGLDTAGPSGAYWRVRNRVDPCGL